jgi:hypothetical protein
MGCGALSGRGKLSRALVAAVGVLTLGGCYSPPTPFPGLPRMGVATQFGIQNLCNVGVSPQIKLSKVPDGTTDYVVQITDTDVLIQTPWRETIPFADKAEIPEGAAKTFVGPCLGDNTRFPPLAPYGYVFRVEVLAQNAGGKPLAYGATNVLVQSPYLTARRLRLQQQQPAPGAPGAGAYPGGAPGPIQLPYSNFPPGMSPGYGILQ